MLKLEKKRIGAQTKILKLAFQILIYTTKTRGGFIPYTTQHFRTMVLKYN